MILHDFTPEGSSNATVIITLKNHWNQNPEENIHAHFKCLPHLLPFPVNIIKFPLNVAVLLLLWLVIGKEVLSQHCEGQRDAIRRLQ